MRFLNTAHPFFRPAWRRYIVVGAPFIWAGVEYGFGSPVWAYLCAAIGGVLAWHLIIAWRDDEGAD